MADSTEGGLSYLQAAGIAFNPLQSGFSIGDAFNTLANNGIFGLGGYVSPGTKQGIVSDETAALVQAGMNANDAATAALTDVTATLTSANADPSQAPSWLQNIGTYLNWAIAILALFLAIKVMSVLK